MSSPFFYIFEYIKLMKIMGPERFPPKGFTENKIFLVPLTSFGKPPARPL